MSQEETLSRRKFIGAAAAGAAGIAALGSWAPKALSGPDGKGERLIPPGKLSIQQFSIRDAITRLNGSVMGRLGGPNFPEDPADLGPLVALPGGFAAVFEFLASLGYRGIEFFSFNQGANGPITTQEIRTALDNAGLASTGTHTGGLGTMFNPNDPSQAGRQAQIEIANILGHTIIGTAGDPSGRNTLADNPANPNQIGWQTAADRYNIVGAALAAQGLRYYLHPEQNTYNFFDPVVHPELAGVRRIEWFTDHTDPSVVFFEPDILHCFAGRARFPGDDFDPLSYWVANSKRLLAWHVKDGSRIVPPPAPPTNPFTQTIVRAPGFTDVIYAGEGSIGQGYPVDPDPAVVGFKRIFDEVGAKGSRYYIIESDSGPGPANDPGRSLRHAKISLQNMLGLRAAPSSRTGKSTERDDAPLESEAEVTG
jgi:sugar phosphate isomerase/epimerase